MEMDRSSGLGKLFMTAFLMVQAVLVLVVGLTLEHFG
jgi:hypothetical protein